MHFSSVSLYVLLCATFYANLCRHNKVTANDKVGRFFQHTVYRKLGRVMIMKLVNISHHTCVNIHVL